MKIAVVNDIHVGKSLEHDGKVRASSHLIENTLKDFLQSIQQQHSPDILINLGDLIRSESKEFDLRGKLDDKDYFFKVRGVFYDF